MLAGWKRQWNLRSSWFLLLGFATVLFVACSSGGSQSTSKTPRIVSGSSDLEAGLVSVGQLRQIPALAELRAAPRSKYGTFVNPDPRGPCGKRISQPDYSKGALKSYLERTEGVTTILVKVSDRKAKGFLDSMINDSQPPCRPYTSTTNTGATQHVDPTIVSLPPVGTQRSGALLKITIGEQTTYGGAIVVRRGGYVGSITVISTRPLSSGLLSALAPRVDAAIRHVATAAT